MALDAQPHDPINRRPLSIQVGAGFRPVVRIALLVPAPSSLQPKGDEFIGGSNCPCSEDPTPASNFRHLVG
jgi:hypothetical protein